MRRALLSASILGATLVLTAASAQAAGTPNSAAAGPSATGAAAHEVPAADRQALLKEIDAYLASLSVMTGSFSQVEPSGDVSQGKFWIDRPGKMRFEYADPNPYTLISDGANYTVWDRELQDINTQVALRATPLNIFLKRDVKVESDAEVVGLTENGDELALTLKDHDPKVAGTLTLVFSQPSLELRRFATTDESGAATEVSLKDTVKGGKVDPALFVVREPRPRDRDR
jgi:outer membrane lipoprotein-sorting protein